MKVQRLSNKYIGGFLVFLSVLMAYPLLDQSFGWSGWFAPDVIYGFESRFFEGIILILVTVLLWRGNARAGLYAATMVVFNIAAFVFGYFSLRATLDTFCTIVWIFVLAIAYQPPPKLALMTSGQDSQS